ncbi:hypothetical protein JO388_09420 [Streptococcus suis]|uniref:hypothetical protein n=1 Tax=Streptococcus suis TaxID=1307 RepID=UPI0019611877|nr:hypothetical protein [Streptococcus suis]MBM7180489.1 hypothetical protein [Streptococcus suis]
MGWNKFALRKTDSEEKAYFGTDEIWNYPVPDSETKVLVSDGFSIWMDEWYQDSDGANLMDTDALGLYWMPLPEPPKEVE